MKVIEETINKLVFEEAPLYTKIKTQTERTQKINFIGITLTVITVLLFPRIEISTKILIFLIFIIIYLTVYVYIKATNFIAGSYIIKVRADKKAKKLLIKSSNDILTWWIDLRRNTSPLSLNIIPTQPTQVDLFRVKSIIYNSRIIFPFGLGKFIFILDNDNKVYFYTYASDLFFGRFSQSGYKAICQKIATFIQVPFDIN